MTTLVLAHGAGAGQAHPWMRHVAAGVEARGLRVVTFDFPYIAEGRKLPDKAPVLEAAFIKVWEDAARTATGPMFAAGKSLGGRIPVIALTAYGRPQDKRRALAAGFRMHLTKPITPEALASALAVLAPKR